VRRVLLAGVLAAACLMLSGCLKIDISLTVNRDDTVSGSIILGIDKRVAGLTGQTEEQLARSMMENSQLPRGARNEPYSDDTFVGARVVYDKVPLADFNAGSSDPDGLRITHVDGRYRVTGVIDLSEVDFSNPAISNFADTFQARIAITMPGKVLEHNGTLDGRTVTWNPKPGDRLEMLAVSEEAGLFGWTTDRWLLVGGVAVTCCLLVTLVLAGLIFWMLRRSRRSAPVDDAPVPPPGEGPPVEGPPVEGPTGTAVWPPVSDSAGGPPPSEHSPGPTEDPSGPPRW